MPIPESFGHNGAYRIVSVIGRGGFATVYKAYQSSLDRHVAIKVLRSDMVEDATGLERFQREARAAARLSGHQNIVTIYDYGEQDGAAFLVLELIEGTTLHDRLAQPLPFSDVDRIVTGVAAALDYAHSNQLVHRDVKPGNVLLSEDGRVVLSDFGIAKLLDSATALTGNVIGTPEYMSPEQINGSDIDGRSDIYSLGVMLYRMLTGRAPFSGAPMAVLHQHMTAPPPPMGASVHGRPVPEPVERVVQRSLEKERERRYDTAGQMAAGLTRALAPLVAVERALSALRRGNLDRAEELGNQLLADPQVQTEARQILREVERRHQLARAKQSVAAAVEAADWAGALAEIERSRLREIGDTEALQLVDRAERGLRSEEEREARERAERERAEREARERLAREQAEREARERLAREQAEREARERLAREQAEREERERLAREQAEREERERLAREQAEREERERLAREQAEREERERLAREQAEREERERLAREQAEREERERLAREQAEHKERERLAREQAEREERDRLAREKAEREERERLAREKAERDERERLAREKAEREERERLAREQAEREEREREAARRSETMAVPFVSEPTAANLSPHSNPQQDEESSTIAGVTIASLPPLRERSATVQRERLEATRVQPVEPAALHVTPGQPSRPAGLIAAAIAAVLLIAGGGIAFSTGMIGGGTPSLTPTPGQVAAIAPATEPTPSRATPISTTAAAAPPTVIPAAVPSTPPAAPTTAPPSAPTTAPASTPPNPPATSPPRPVLSPRVVAADGAEMVLIPAGPFRIGSDTDPSAMPAHTLDLAAFYADVFEVTNARFAAFVAQSGYAPKGEWRKFFDQTQYDAAHYDLQRESHPVVNVTWADADAYCKWAKKRLPTEAEWEKAARGADGRRWPWGNEPHPDFANVETNDESGREPDTARVGTFAKGAGPFGLQDSVGNVWEWTASTQVPYPLSPATAAESAGGAANSPRVTRGASWLSLPDKSEVTIRLTEPPTKTSKDLGFRCVAAVDPVPGR
ncbi:MAG: bifunctional serine/threonine-protein kinase/formylglycine-generating enzyme family protein [Chloroflexota bacterium]